MLNVSVITRCPLMKTPNEPESTVWGADGFNLSCLSEAFSAAKVTTPPNSANPMIQPVATPSFNRLLLRVKRSRSVWLTPQAQSPRNRACHLIHAPASGFHPHRNLGDHVLP